MMSHSLGSVKSALGCSSYCGCNKGWKVQRFYQKKVKITSVYLIAICAKISCCDSNIFTHSSTHIAVMSDEGGAVLSLNKGSCFKIHC